MTTTTNRKAPMAADPFRRFASSQTTLYPRVWCDGCASNDFCRIEGHQVGLCTVCGERGPNAHTHDVGIEADMLKRRLAEFDEWHFDPVVGPNGELIIQTAGRHQFVTGTLHLQHDGKRRDQYCIGQATNGDVNRYGPAGLVTRAISNGARAHGLVAARQLDEPPDALQPLAGATVIDIDRPEKPAPEAAGIHFSTRARELVDEHELTSTAIRKFGKSRCTDVRLGSSPSAMLMTLATAIYGDAYTPAHLEMVAETISKGTEPKADPEPSTRPVPQAGCPECVGRGYDDDDDPCSACGGTGVDE